MKIYKLIIVLLFLPTAFVFSQIKYDGSFGKGLKFNTEDDSFYLKFRTRIQPRWDFEKTEESEVKNQGKVKRARLKFDGYFINPDLRFKIEYDVVGGYVRDAMVKYNVSTESFGDFDFWFGQGKLPGNRERVVSSANLQFVDRSVFNKYFNLDRDNGIQLHHNFSIGNVLIRDRYAISSGNGILENKKSEGLAYTSKIEVLPMGKFTKKGDYVSADVYREKSPKLSITGFASYNSDSYKSRGQLGEEMFENLGGLDGDSELIKSDLLSLGADMLFKYKGFSFACEVGERRVLDSDAKESDTYIGYGGFGSNIQSGYVFKNMWELSGRYAFVDSYSSNNYNIKDYTLGISKYIVYNAFKIQADFTYRETEKESKLLESTIARLQIEMQF